MKRLHRTAENPRAVLITGGAGFIGTNLAHRLLSFGSEVIILDNLSRPGVERNLRWLRTQHRERLTVVVADVRDEKGVTGAVRQSGQVYHLAASATAAGGVDPITDFEVNARGTLNLLDAVRQQSRPIPFLFTSTSQVYGALRELALHDTETRYAAPRASALSDGLGEARALEFLSPYGCSKGAAEQYVLAYARNVGLRATVFRLSCIYGPHQCGDPDQDWLTHLVLHALRREPIAFAVDGRQVRDMLFIDELVDAMLFAQANSEALHGRPFNLGGGPANTLSPLELVRLLTELDGEVPRVSFEKGRAAEPRFYVSDIRRFSAATGWKPRVGVREGVRRLQRWLIEHRVAVAEAEQISPPTALQVGGQDIELNRPWVAR